MSLKTEREMLRKLAEEAKAAAKAARAARRRKPTPEETARRIAGVCRECDRPVDGKPKVAVRCKEHRVADQRRRALELHRRKGKEYSKRWRAKHPDRHIAGVKSWRERNRQRHLDYKREYRRKNRDKVKQQKRRAALRHSWKGEGPAGYMRQYRDRVKAGLHKPKQTKRNKNGERLCLYPYCRTVLTGRPKLCPKHKEVGMPKKARQDVAA